MPNERRPTPAETSAEKPLGNLEHSRTEKTTEKIEKIKTNILEIERLYQLSTNLDSVHSNAICGLLAAISTLLREEAVFIKTSPTTAISSHTVGMTARELIKQSLSDMGLELKDSSQF